MDITEPLTEYHRYGFRTEPQTGTSSKITRIQPPDRTHWSDQSLGQGCTNRYETAEYLEVTEEFLEECISCYREKYGVYKIGR